SPPSYWWGPWPFLQSRQYLQPVPVHKGNLIRAASLRLLPVSQGMHPVHLDQHLMRMEEQLALFTLAVAYQPTMPTAVMLSLSMMWPVSRYHNTIRSNRH